MTLQTPLHDRHGSLGAKMVPFGGYWMPIQYSGILDEHEAVRTDAGVFDLSHMGEFLVRGPAALTDVQRLVTNDVASLEPGRALYTPMCNPAGGIIDDLLVYRRDEQDFLLVVNASNIAKDLHWVREEVGAETEVEDASAATALVAVQGPSAARHVESLVPGVGRLRPFSFLEIERPRGTWVVSRTGYTGEDGFEIYVPAADAASVFDHFIERGVKPVGLGARDTLRLEARLLLYGNDIDETTTPLEAGIAWTVKFEKGSFIGRDSLAAQRDQGPARRLVGFKLDGRAIARAGHEVRIGGEPAGTVRSGGFSPSLKEPIGLAYLPAGSTEPGTRVTVRIRSNDVDGVVVKTPFYRRPRETARNAQGSVG